MQQEAQLEEQRPRSSSGVLRQSLASCRDVNQQVPLVAASTLNELRWTGDDSVRIVELHVSVGSAILSGDCVGRVCRLEHFDDAPFGQGDTYSAFTYNLASDTYPLGGAADSVVGAVIDNDKRVAMSTELVWNGSNGCVSAVHVAVGSVVAPNGCILTVDNSVHQQRCAHLHAADSLAWQSSSGAASDHTSVNARFQELVHELQHGLEEGKGDERASSLVQLLHDCDALEDLAHDFLETARLYGRTIISELHLPLQDKTVRPVSVGGVLGGSKYFVRGVLFKMASDAPGSLFSAYPDPMHVANKVQGLDLKGQEAYFHWFFSRGSVDLVSFPLTALIDYKGHRITAMTRLPIQGQSTLIYGCSNAGSGCQVENKLPEWSNFIADASQGLGLKAHHVMHGSSGEAQVSSCIDLEGHKGTDGRFYLLDFSRALPCAFKKDRERESYDTMWPFYHMMRPEFVARWKEPLSADACSSFQSTVTQQRKEEAKQDNAQVREATEHLRTVIVAKVCQRLVDAAKGLTLVSLSQLFHAQGLNMRYLGLVYDLLCNEASPLDVRCLVVVEALVRAFKGYFRSRLRRMHATMGGLQSTLLSEAALLLNVAFGTCEESEFVRENASVLSLLRQSFCFSPNRSEQACRCFLGDSFLGQLDNRGQRLVLPVKIVVLERLNQVIGLGLDATLLSRLRLQPDQLNSRRFFEGVHVRFEERVKHLDIVDRARGLRLFLEGLQQGQQHAVDHLQAALGTMERVAERSPLDAWPRVLLGRVCLELWKAQSTSLEQRMDVPLAGSSRNAIVLRELTADINMVQVYAKRAEEYFLQAIALDRHSVKAHRFYAELLVAQQRWNDAEVQFLKGIKACHSQGLELDQACLSGVVNALERNGKQEQALLVKQFDTSWSIERETLWKRGLGCSQFPLPVMGGGADVQQTAQGMLVAESSSPNLRNVLHQSRLSASSSPTESQSPPVRLRQASPRLASRAKQIVETARRKSPRLRSSARSASSGDSNSAARPSSLDSQLPDGYGALVLGGAASPLAQSATFSKPASRTSRHLSEFEGFQDMSP